MLAADAQRHVETAARGLMATVAAVGRSLPEGAVSEGLDVSLAAPLVEIIGASLGLSVCVAMLSRAVGQAPAQDIAATARVHADGRLATVGFVREKLVALRERWPGVRKVVVAKGQEIGEPRPEGFEIIERASVAEAVVDFGLGFDALPACELEAQQARLAGFAAENARLHTVDEWLALSRSAWEVSRALAGDPHEAHRAAEAAAWAALFALHGGDAGGVEDYLRVVPEAMEGALPPFVRAWKHVVAASACIDRDPAQAVGMAARAIEEARGLQGDEARVYGYALGTHGRALMHAGQLAEAEVPLRAAVAWQQRVAPYEEARSRNYLATCLRKQGRAAEALAEVEAAIALSEAKYPARAASKTTRMYLELERGRCLLEMGRADEAVGAFERVRRQQGSDVDYPRLGAVRGLAAAYRAMGRREEADEALRRCLEVAGSGQGVLQRVAVMAAGDALLEETGATGVARQEIERVWRALFPGAEDGAAVRDVVSRWVY